MEDFDDLFEQSDAAVAREWGKELLRVVRDDEPDTVAVVRRLSSNSVLIAMGSKDYNEALTLACCRALSDARWFDVARAFSTKNTALSLLISTIKVGKRSLLELAVDCDVSDADFTWLAQHFSDEDHTLAALDLVSRFILSTPDDEHERLARVVRVHDLVPPSAWPRVTAAALPFAKSQDPEVRRRASMFVP